MKRSTNLT